MFLPKRFREHLLSGQYLRQEAVYLPPVKKSKKRVPWREARELIWDRDGGICQVCGLVLNDGRKAYYQCGHIIDRSLGGSDETFNLVVMCVFCNQLKPLTKTRRLYIQWVQQHRMEAWYIKRDKGTT